VNSTPALLFRWFVGLGIDDAVWDASTFSKNRDRLLGGSVAAAFLSAVLAIPRVMRLLSNDHFSVDGTLIAAWASMKAGAESRAHANTRPPTSSRPGCPRTRAEPARSARGLSRESDRGGMRERHGALRELRERGYPGTSRQVHRFVAERRTKPTRSVRKPQRETAAVPEPRVSGSPLPTSRELAWLLVQPLSALDAAAAAVVAHVERDAIAGAVADLARRFTVLVRASGVGRTAAEGRDAIAEFGAWIMEAKACGASAIASFASGLETDATAVRAALTEPWSSGQAEGQINRLKLIKRQSYGRAGLDLLRRRMLLAA